MVAERDRLAAVDANSGVSTVRTLPSPELERRSETSSTAVQLANAGLTGSYGYVSLMIIYGRTTHKESGR